MRISILALTCLLGGAAYAHEGKHDTATANTRAGTTLTGEVVDLTCYASHAGQGSKHAKCALDCIKKGNPVAILSNDVLYAVISSDHESPNAKLASFAGKQVVVTGEQSEKNGMHFVDLDKVEEAPASAKK